MLPGLSRMQWAPAVDRLERERVVEVDVGDHRDRRALDDRLERVRVPVARHRHPHELAAGVDHRGRSARRVASTSLVSVLVIDCTTTGAPPPTGTPPTQIWRFEDTDEGYRRSLRQPE